MDEIPTWLVAIDPGTAAAGMAAFHDGVLIDAIHLHRPSWFDYCNWGGSVAGPMAVWVREEMTKYPGRRRAHKNLRLIEELMGRVVAFGDITWDRKVKAREWKGSVPKPQHHARLRRLLTPEELLVWDACDSADARDAIGIGLFCLGRCKRGGVA